MNNRFDQYKITADLLPAGIPIRELLDGPAPVGAAEIDAALGLLVPENGGYELIRIGGPGDGGYLLPDDLHGIEACFSPGVNNFKKFEDQLATTYGIKSFMCDFTSDAEKLRTPLIPGLQQFEKKWLDVTDSPDNLDLNRWVAGNTSPAGDIILQIDIEGAEYRNLLHASEETLSRFRMIVIEYHGLGFLNDPAFLRGIFQPVAQKLSKHFASVHAHGNNCCQVASYDGGWTVPTVLEITYLRKDRVRKSNSKLLVPHPLDDINVTWNPPIRLGGPWLRNADPVMSELVHLRQSMEWMQEQMVAARKEREKMQTQLNVCGMEIHSRLRKRFGKSENVALGKEASQSSLSEHSGPEGANGAINGKKTGRFGIHTSVEKSPWWMVDLKETYELEGMLIYNRTDACPGRADKLKVSISEDGTNWTRIYNHAGKPTFGGYVSENCGFPLHVNTRKKHARYVRIACPGNACLHLDEVEIYGIRPGTERVAPKKSPKRKDKKRARSFP